MGACGGFHDQGGDGVGVVRHRHMTAARQGLELGAGRKLVEVPGLMREPEPPALARCAPAWARSPESGQIDRNDIEVFSKSS